MEGLENFYFEMAVTMRCLALRELGQWLGALSVLTEDPHGGCNSSSIGSDTCFGLSEHIMCVLRMHTCRQTFIPQNFKTHKNPIK